MGSAYAEMNWLSVASCQFLLVDVAKHVIIHKSLVQKPYTEVYPLPDTGPWKG